MVGQFGRLIVLDVTVPPAVGVTGKTMDGMGMIGTGVKASPELRPPPTYTGENDIEDVVTVTAVVIVSVRVEEGPW